MGTGSKMAKSHGAKISQRDYSAVSSKDYKMGYSSSFPSLSIVASGSFSVAPNNTIYTHSLGYVPMFVIYYDGTNGIGVGSTGDSFMLDNFVNNWFDMDTTKLVLNSTASSTTTGRYYIYGTDITTDFTAPIINSGTDTDITSGARAFGVKVSKQGKDVSSTDLRDFTIHSGTRSPLIHSVTTGTYTATSTVTVTHSLGYEPFVFLYWKFASGPGVWEHIPDQAVTVSTTQVSFTNSSGATGDSYSLVILKDPLEVN